MAVKSRDVLKTYFETGDYPTQEQFWDWLDSFVHKYEDAGSVVHFGATIPAIELGRNGDVYMRTALPYTIYRKVAGLWAPQFNAAATLVRVNDVTYNPVDGVVDIGSGYIKTDDLAGYATQSWVQAQGYLSVLPAHTHSLADLSPSGATNGQVPQWNGSAWVPTTISTSNIYNSNGTLTGNRQITLGGNSLSFLNGSSVPFHVFSDGRFYSGAGPITNDKSWVGFQFRYDRGYFGSEGQWSGVDNARYVIQYDNSQGGQVFAFIPREMQQINNFYTGTLHIVGQGTVRRMVQLYQYGDDIAGTTIYAHKERTRISDINYLSPSNNLNAQVGDHVHTQSYGSNVYSSPTDIGVRRVPAYMRVLVESVDPSTRSIHMNFNWVTNNQTRLVIRGESGNILINTNIDAGFKLDINGTARVAHTFKVGANTPHNSSAVLDIESTTKGFLPPRMTGAQAEAISSPAEGLMVYVNNGNGTVTTSTGWWGYNGTTWVKLN